MKEKPLRLGLIIPSSNTTAEKEFFQMTAPFPWISIHTSRVGLVEVTTKSLNQMMENIIKAAALLADAAVDGICLACTSASFIGGIEKAASLSSRIEKATGIPSITTSESVIMACEAVGARRLALVTPYVEKLNRLEIEFLKSALPGLEIVGIKSFHLKSNLRIGRLSSGRIFQASKTLVEELHPDTLFLSCTNMPTIDIIQPLEDEFSISVISSNSASLFGLLKLLNQALRIEGLGKLFR